MAPAPRLARALACAVLVTVAGCHHRSAPHTLKAPAGETAAAGAPERAAGAAAAARAGRAAADDGGVANVGPTSRIEDLFAHRYPGLEVHRTGTGDLHMLLRGRVPLLLLDGLEVDPVALLTVHPSTVRSIEVLRNLSETAVYGSRGINGVVRVTTGRRGR